MVSGRDEKLPSACESHSEPWLSESGDGPYQRMSVVPLPSKSPSATSYVPNTERATERWVPSVLKNQIESALGPGAYQNTSAVASLLKYPTMGRYSPEMLSGLEAKVPS